MPATVRTLKLMRTDRPPQVTAAAAVVMDAASGQVVYEKNSHAHRANASTTKMMTALLALENAKLDDVVTAGPDVKVEPTIIGLDPGDQLTVEQLLYGLLLPSGNDAAIALAEYVGGSIPRFAAMMNAKAAQLGMKDSHFVTPNGLDAEGHYSSAYDLALLARAAMQNPVFEKIVATKEYRVTGPVKWVFKNNNRMLDSYPGADGIKTGYTDNAGRCLVSSATRKGRRAIAVVLDSVDLWGDSSALLDYFFASYSWETLRVADVPLGDYGRNGGLRRTVARSEAEIAFPIWQRTYLRWFFSMSSSSSREDGAVGAVSYYLFGKKVAEIELYDAGG